MRLALAASFILGLSITFGIVEVFPLKLNTKSYFYFLKQKLPVFGAVICYQKTTLLICKNVPSVLRNDGNVISVGVWIMCPVE